MNQKTLINVQKSKIEQISGKKFISTTVIVFKILKIQMLLKMNL